MFQPATAIRDKVVYNLMSVHFEKRLVATDYLNMLTIFFTNADSGDRWITVDVRFWVSN